MHKTSTYIDYTSYMRTFWNTTGPFDTHHVCLFQKQVHLLHTICAYIFDIQQVHLTHKTCVFSKMKRKRHFFAQTMYMVYYNTIYAYIFDIQQVHVTHNMYVISKMFWHEFIVFISQGFINILKVISTTFSLLPTHICVTSRYVNLQVWIRSLYFHNMIYKLLLCFVSFYIVDGFSLKHSHHS